MNKDTIKAATIKAGEEYFKQNYSDIVKQKDEQIKELVEFIEGIKSYLGPHTTDKANELIQKYKG